MISGFSIGCHDGWMLSNAFLKSTKFIQREIEAFHSKHCSMMLRRVNIWSIHPLPFLKPVCSCRSLVSMASSIRFKRILQNTLLGVDRSVIPRQLSQFRRSPFLGSCTMSPLVQSTGMVSVFQMLLKRPVSTLVAVLISFFLRTEGKCGCN